MNKLTHNKQSDRGIDDELQRIISALNLVIDKVADPSTAYPKDTGNVGIQAVTVGNNEYSLSVRTKDGVINSVPGMFIKSDEVHNSNSPRFNYQSAVGAITTTQTNLGLVTTVQGALVIAEEARETAWGGPVATTLSDINSTEGTKLAGIAAGATVGATWGTNLNSVPARLSGISLPTPCVAITENFIGFYNSGTQTDPANWPIKIYNDSGTGKFYVGNAGATKYLSYDAGTSSLTLLDATITSVGNHTTYGDVLIEAGNVKLKDATGNYVGGAVCNSVDGFLYLLGKGRVEFYSEAWTSYGGIDYDTLWVSGGGLYISRSVTNPTTANSGIRFGGAVAGTSDTGLYRAGVNILKTDGTINAVVALQVNGTDIDTIFAPISHEHVGTDITSGEVGYSYLPTGLTANHVCPGINGVSVGVKNASGVWASNDSGGATDHRIKTLPVDIGGSTYYLLIDEFA